MSTVQISLERRQMWAIQSLWGEKSEDSVWCCSDLLWKKKRPLWECEKQETEAKVSIWSNLIFVYRKNIWDVKEISFLIFLFKDLKNSGTSVTFLFYQRMLWNKQGIAMTQS